MAIELLALLCFQDGELPLLFAVIHPPDAS